MTGSPGLPILTTSAGFSGQDHTAWPMLKLSSILSWPPGLEGSLLYDQAGMTSVRCMFLPLSWLRLSPDWGAPLYSLTEAIHPSGPSRDQKPQEHGWFPNSSFARRLCLSLCRMSVFFQKHLQTRREKGSVFNISENSKTVVSTFLLKTVSCS